jgi:hypothetical protein
MMYSRAMPRDAARDHAEGGVLVRLGPIEVICLPCQELLVAEQGRWLRRLRHMLGICQDDDGIERWQPIR